MLAERQIMGVNVVIDERFHALLRGLTLYITCGLSFSLHALAQESNIPIAWFEETGQQRTVS